MKRFAILFLVACAGGGSGVPDGGGRRDAMTPDGGEDAGTDAAFDAMVSADCEGMPEGTPCDSDGDGCTMDLCRRGRCVLGGPADCDDGVSCTTDSCVATGAMTFMCANEVTGSVCVIDGICVDDGGSNPADGCQICDVSMPDDWTISTGTCDDGDVCTTGDTCATGTCVGTPNLDSYETNDTRAAAHDLGDITDAAGLEAISPTLYPEPDEDWFRYFDEDTVGRSIFPMVELQNIPSGSNYDVCVYVDCEGAGVDRFDCDMGTEVANGPGLDDNACCSTNAGNADEAVRLDHSCDRFTDDSTNVFVHVVKVEGPASCETPYELLWGDS